jgi:hypothetical protein
MWLAWAGAGVSHPAEASVPQEQLRPPETGHVQVLRLRDGSTLVGRIVRVEGEAVLFETEGGTLTVPLSALDRVIVRPGASVRRGAYWFPNPNATRLYFAPTGRMLERGRGYFADYYLFFPGVAYGLTSNVTAGAGMSLVPGLAVDEQVFYFTPKVGVAAGRRVNLAAGALVVRYPTDFDLDDTDEATLLGILYAVGTHGTPDASVTAGVGYGFADGRLADKPMLMVGAERRLSRRIAFVTENWLIPEVVDQPVVSYGVRFFGEGIAVDLALVNVFGKDALFPGVPYVDFVVNF